MRPDCYHQKNGRCSILSPVLSCEGCRFFATPEQVREARQKSFNLRMRRGLFPTDFDRKQLLSGQLHWEESR